MDRCNLTLILNIPSFHVCVCSSPSSETKRFTFNAKRPRRISDEDLEKDPFSIGSSDEETKKAIEESKADEERRKQNDDAFKKVMGFTWVK